MCIYIYNIYIYIYKYIHTSNVSLSLSICISCSYLHEGTSRNQQAGHDGIPSHCGAIAAWLKVMSPCFPMVEVFVCINTYVYIYIYIYVYNDICL